MIAIRDERICCSCIIRRGEPSATKMTCLGSSYGWHSIWDIMQFRTYLLPFSHTCWIFHDGVSYFPHFAISFLKCKIVFPLFLYTFYHLSLWRSLHLPFLCLLSFQLYFSFTRHTTSHHIQHTNPIIFSITIKLLKIFNNHKSTILVKYNTYENQSSIQLFPNVLLMWP